MICFFSLPCFWFVVSVCWERALDAVEGDTVDFHVLSVWI